MNRPAKFAVIPSMQTPAGRMPKLRWLQTSTRDVSSGGVLVQTTSSLEQYSYVLLSIDLEGFPLPSLVVGQVRYTYPTDGGKIATGIEFIVNEDKDKHTSSGAISRLPAVVFEYNRDLQQNVEARLKAWMQKNNTAQTVRSMDS
jgi:Tfp pilus assembly protein PilZ